MGNQNNTQEEKTEEIVKEFRSRDRLFKNLRNNVSEDMIKYNTRDDPIEHVAQAMPGRDVGVLVIYPWFGRPDGFTQGRGENLIYGIISDNQKDSPIEHQTDDAVLFSRLKSQNDAVHGTETLEEVWIPKSAIMYCGYFEREEVDHPRY